MRRKARVRHDDLSQQIARCLLYVYVCMCSVCGAIFLHTFTSQSDILLSFVQRSARPLLGVSRTSRYG